MGKIYFKRILLSIFISFVFFIFIANMTLRIDFISYAQNNNSYTKQYCKATMEDDFSLTEILVVIMPYENSTVYTKNSFIDIGCLSVNELTAHNSRNDLRRILELQVACKDKSELLQCIKLLEQRSDIYSAEPNYYIEGLSAFIDTPNDAME